MLKIVVHSRDKLSLSSQTLSTLSVSVSSVEATVASSQVT